MFNFDRLRALAKKQGITITHLCNIVGKKNSYIADSQNKGIAIPLDAVETWASALHTTPAYLLEETDDPSEGKKNNPATAQDARQRDIVVLTRMASQLPEEDYNRLVKNFEDTIDIYLRARGLDPDDYR